MPKVFTGIENLKIDPKKGLIMPVQSQSTPYADTDEAGNTIYVQKMPDYLKELRYGLLNKGVGLPLPTNLSQDIIRQAVPEWFGGTAPSLEEYPTTYQPGYMSRGGPTVSSRPATFGGGQQLQPTQGQSNYEAYGNAHGVFGEQNPFYQDYVNEYGAGSIEGTKANAGLALNAPMPPKPPPPITTITGFTLVDQTNQNLYPSVPEGTKLAHISNGQLVAVSDEVYQVWTGGSVDADVKRGQLQPEDISQIPPNRIYIGSKGGQIFTLPADISNYAIAQDPIVGQIKNLQTGEFVPATQAQIDERQQLYDTQQAMQDMIDTYFPLISKTEESQVQKQNYQEYMSLSEAIGKVYPYDEFIKDAGQVIRWLQSDPANLVKFTQDIQSVGRTPETELLLKTIAPNITEDGIDSFFAPRVTMGAVPPREITMGASTVPSPTLPKPANLWVMGKETSIPDYITRLQNTKMPAWLNQLIPDWNQGLIPQVGLHVPERTVAEAAGAGAMTSMMFVLPPFKWAGTVDILTGMKLAERIALAKEAGLAGKVGKKAIDTWTKEEVTAAATILEKQGKLAKAIPKAAPGEPEAGLQPSMIPEEVAGKEVFPKGKGRITQINMDEAAKLAQYRSTEELAGLKETLASNRAADLTDILTRGKDAGEVRTITVKKLSELTGKSDWKNTVTLANGQKAVKWENALDELAVNRGFADAEAVKTAIEDAAKVKAQIKVLESDLAKGITPPEAVKPPPVETPLVKGGAEVPPVKPPEPVAAAEFLIKQEIGGAAEIEKLRKARGSVARDLTEFVTPERLARRAQYEARLSKISKFGDMETARQDLAAAKKILKKDYQGIANPEADAEIARAERYIAETKPTSTPSPSSKPPAVVKGGAEVPPVKPPSPISDILPPKPSPEGILGNLQNTDELVETMVKTDVFRKIANLPVIKQIQHYLNPAAVAKTPAEKVIVARAALREEGANKVTGAFARLEAIGKRDDVWGKITKEGFIPEGKFGGLTLDDVLTYRQKYDAYLTPQQRQWANAFHELEEAKLKLLTDNGIKINELTFEEGGEYVGRRIVGRINQQTGEFAESAFVGTPGPGRPGAKLSAEKTRYFKDINEAIDEGYRYLPPDEALYLNLKAAYNRIADKQAAEWILDRIAYRTTGAPEALQVAALNARTKLWKSRQLESALNRAVRGERLPDATIASIAETFPSEGARLKALIPSLQSGKPVANEVQSLTAKAKLLTADAEKGYYKAVDIRARAREAAMRPRLEEAAVQAPAFAGKILTGAEAKETANTLSKAFTTQYGDLDQVIGAVNKVNALGRYFVLAGDASPLLIQLITFPARFPKVWGKSAVNFVKALFNVESQAKYLAANNAIIQKSRNLILTKGGQTEFTEAFRAGGIMQSKLARVGKTVLEPFQRGFEAALDTAGIELRKAFEYMATTPERTAEIEQFINIIRGVTSSARIGVSPGIRAAETALILAPRYNRATFALVSDIARGGIRGDQARKALGSLIGAGAAMGAAITLARGEGWEKVIDHLDITNTREFMTWEVAGQRIGPGSKMRSLTVLLGKIIKDPDDTVKYATDFIKGNFSPVLGTGVDVVMGEGYMGEVTRPGKPLGGFPGEKGASLAEGTLGLTRAVIAENLLPLWVQSMLESGELGGRIVRGIAEFLGGRAYPERDWTEDFRKLGLPLYEGYSVLTSEMPVYNTRQYFSDTSRKLGDTETEKVIRTKEYPVMVKSVIEARDIKRGMEQYPNQILANINADPKKGDTFNEFYEQWIARQALGNDEAKLAEFDKRYPQAEKGNMTQRQYVLLRQYNQISPTDTNGRQQFLRDNPEINVNPREDYMQSHPDENAQLAVWGQAKIYSQKAYDKAMALAKSLDIPHNALPDFGVPPDADTRDAYFKYQDAVAKFTSDSPEAHLILQQNDKLREYLGRKTPITTPTPALEIDIKNRKLNDQYEVLTSEKAKQEFEATNPKWTDDNLRIQAYKKQYAWDNTEADKKVVEDYVKYKTTEYNDYEDEWFLQEHPELYKFLTTAGGIKPKDFSKVPTKEVFKMFEGYSTLPAGEARLVYRMSNPKLDEWMVRTGQVKPIEFPSFDILALYKQYTAISGERNRQIFRMNHPTLEAWLVNEGKIPVESVRINRGATIGQGKQPEQPLYPHPVAPKPAQNTRGGIIIPRRGKPASTKGTVSTLKRTGALR